MLEKGQPRGDDAKYLILISLKAFWKGYYQLRTVEYECLCSELLVNRKPVKNFIRKEDKPSQKRRVMVADPPLYSLLD